MKENIIKYLKGIASDKEKKELLTWLREKEENKALFSEIRDTWLQSELPTTISDPDYIRKSFDLFVKKVTTINSQTKKTRIRFIFKVAAAVAFVCICSWAGYLAGNSKTEDSAPIVINQLVMGKDSKGSVVLPDGSTVWLNANSKLVYPEHFAADNRRVKLEGEGYFEVRKDIQKPFLVETDDITIKVLGTRFDVQNYKEKETLKTTLLSGRVEISFLGRQKKITLVPNQSLTFHRKSEEYYLDEVDAADCILWINNQLTCTNDKLKNVLHKLQHWYGLDIVCDKNVPMQQSLSLTVRRETPEELFKVLELICPIRCTIKDNTVYIKSK